MDRWTGPGTVHRQHPHRWISVSVVFVVYILKINLIGNYIPIKIFAWQNQKDNDNQKTKKDNSTYVKKR